MYPKNIYIYIYVIFGLPLSKNTKDGKLENSNTIQGGFCSAEANHLGSNQKGAGINGQIPVSYSTRNHRSFISNPMVKL